MFINTFTAKIICQTQIKKLAVDMFGLKNMEALLSYCTHQDDDMESFEPHIPYSKENMDKAYEDGTNITRACVMKVNGEEILFLAFTCVEYNNGFEHGFINFPLFSDEDLKKISDFCEFEKE